MFELTFIFKRSILWTFAKKKSYMIWIYLHFVFDITRSPSQHTHTHTHTHTLHWSGKSLNLSCYLGLNLFWNVYCLILILWHSCLCHVMTSAWTVKQSLASFKPHPSKFSASFWVIHLYTCHIIKDGWTDRQRHTFLYFYYYWWLIALGKWFLTPLGSVDRLIQISFKTFCKIVFLFRFYIQDAVHFFVFSVVCCILNLRKWSVTFAVTSYYPYTEDLDSTVRSMLIYLIQGVIWSSCNFFSCMKWWCFKMTFTNMKPWMTEGNCLSAHLFVFSSKIQKKIYLWSFQKYCSHVVNLTKVKNKWGKGAKSSPFLTSKLDIGKCQDFFHI